MLADSISELDRCVADLRVELAQTKERLAQEIAAHRRVRERFQALSTSLEERVAERTRALAALYEIMVVANQAESLEYLLDEALVQAMGGPHCDTGIVILFEEGPEQTTSSRARVTASRSGTGRRRRTPSAPGSLVAYPATISRTRSNSSASSA